MPRPSRCDDRQKTENAGSRLSRSRRKPANTTRSASPCSRTRRSRAGRSSPSPAITSRASGRRGRSSAIASTSVAWSLCAVSAATLPTTGAASGTPSSARASRPPGSGARSGTPSYTRRSRSAGIPSRSTMPPIARLTTITRAQAAYLRAREGGAQREVDSPHRDARVPRPRAVRPAARRRRRAGRAAAARTAARGGRRRASAQIAGGHRSPRKGSGRTSRPAARARVSSAPPERQATSVATPRAAMPLAVSSTWFCPPRQLAAVSTCRTAPAPAGRRPARGPRCRSCSGAGRGAELAQLRELRERVVGVEHRDDETRAPQQEAALQHVVPEEGPRRPRRTCRRRSSCGRSPGPAAPRASCRSRSCACGRRCRRTDGARARRAAGRPARARPPTRARGRPARPRACGRRGAPASRDTSRFRGSSVRGSRRRAGSGSRRRRSRSPAASGSRSRSSAPTRSSASSASTQSCRAARTAKSRCATKPGQGAFWTTRAPAAVAISRVASLEPESTSTISSQNETLASASAIVFSSFCAMSTAESGITGAV